MQTKRWKLALPFVMLQRMVSLSQNKHSHLWIRDDIPQTKIHSFCQLFHHMMLVRVLILKFHNHPIILGPWDHSESQAFGHKF